MMREEWIGGGGGLQRFASGLLLSGAEIYNSKPRAVEEGNPTSPESQISFYPINIYNKAAALLFK